MYLLLQVRGPFGGFRRKLSGPPRLRELVRNGRCVPFQDMGRFAAVPPAWGYVHQDELHAEAPLWCLAEMQLPVEPAGTMSHWYKSCFGLNQRIR